MLVRDDREKTNITLSEAIEIADDAGMDLVQLSEKDGIAVCKLMNYSKYLYEQKKKEKQSHKSKQEQKEVRISDAIAENDLNVKIKTVERILQDGDKVKITITYRGRMMQFIRRGLEKMVAFESKITLNHVVDKQPSIEGNKVYMIVSPKK